MDQAIKKVDKLIQDIEDLEPSERIQLMKEVSEIYYAPRKDILLDDYIEDMSCDEDCESCNAEDKRQCLLETKRSVLYLLIRMSDMSSTIEKMFRDIGEVTSIVIALRKAAKLDAESEEPTGVEEDSGSSMFV